jgi:hypothetical protein
MRDEREDETITTGIMYLPRVLQNGKQGQVLGYKTKLRLLAAGMDDEISTGTSKF